MEINPYSFPLNKANCEKFIKNADISVQQICRKIINNTMYVSHFDFIRKINEIVNDFLDTYIYSLNKKIINIYDFSSDETYKYKSNLWLFNYIIKYIKTRCKIKFITNIESLNQNDMIIFIDDCIYSGQQMTKSISDFNRDKDKKIKYFILVPYCSLNAQFYIEDELNNTFSGGMDTQKSDSDEDERKRGRSLSLDEDLIIFPEKVQEITPINAILSEDESAKLESFYNSNLINTRSTYLIYFDHKLADKISVPTIFYLGVVPNKKNHVILKDLIYSEIPSNSHKLQIIPIIENCSYYTLNINLLKPACPKPPYNEDYNKTITFMKNLNIIKHTSLSPYKKKLKHYDSKGRSI